MKRTENAVKHYQTFEDLEVYQVAREFRKSMHRVAKRLPEEEKFGLASQIRRAALSLTNNIAEGHGRFHFLVDGASSRVHDAELDDSELNTWFADRFNSSTLHPFNDER